MEKKVVKLTESDLDKIVENTLSELGGIYTHDNWRSKFDQKRSVSFTQAELDELIRQDEEARERLSAESADQVLKVRIGKMKDIVGSALEKVYAAVKAKIGKY